MSHAVDIVYIAVFPSTVMNQTLGCHDFWLIEYGRLMYNSWLIMFPDCCSQLMHLIPIISKNGHQLSSPSKSETCWYNG